jgi:anti-sigma factor RsiW
MTWTCEQIEARLSEYLDGLMAPGERADFAAHANSCATCAPLLASVASLVQELHGLEAVELPPRLVYNILNQTVGPRPQAKRFRGGFGWVSSLPSMRFAYGAISVAATLVVFLAAAGFSFRRPKLADLSPVSLYRRADSGAHLAYARSVKFVSDLRVVYEIQSRLSKDNNELPTEPESTMPRSAPEKNPGSSDSTKPSTPKQQNRANGLTRQVEVLAAQLPLVGSMWTGQLLGRRAR